MKIKLLRPPPPLTVVPTWREIYEAQAFTQRELVSDSRLRSAAKSRDLSLGIGQEALEDLDLAGALRPIAFSLVGYWTGFTTPSEPSDELRFADEGEARSWTEHQWEHDLEPGLPNVTALYSPWQLLYVDDVLDGTGADISLETLLLDRMERERQLDALYGWAERQDEAWRGISAGWTPLMKLLVGAQNRYWPEVSGRLSILPQRNGDRYVRAGPAPEKSTADELLVWLGCSEDELLDAYYFLVERGLNRDPRDGLTLLRRARPRAFHLRWHGLPRRAQDNFDAAEMLRLFLFELTGKQPPRIEAWPLDGRQPERAALYDRGPGARWTRDEVKRELLAAELYPHGVHIIGEGPSEGLVVERLIDSLLGPGAVAQLEFFDLGGSGTAKWVNPLAQAFEKYAIRALVIVDREGQMAEYMNAAVKRGDISAADLCLFDDSLEASNANAQELLDLARKVGNSLVDDSATIQFELSAEELERIHADRRNRTSKFDRPGLADTMLREVKKRTKGALDIDKLDFVEALADFIIEEVDSAGRDDIDELKRRRPIVGFTIDRIAEAINRPRPAGSNP